MPNVLRELPDISFLTDLASLRPDDARLTDVGLICFDAENVVVPLGGYRPSRAYSGMSRRFSDAGFNMMMLTNMTDGTRAGEIAGILDVPFAYKGMLPMDGDTGMASKSHPEIYHHALRTAGTGEHGDRAVMIDDQLKNVVGMAGVPEFSRYFWTMPNFFLEQDLRVMAGRILEVPVGFGLIGFQAYRRSKTSPR